MYSHPTTHTSPTHNGVGATMSTPKNYGPHMNPDPEKRLRWVGRDTAQPADDDAHCGYCGDTTRDLYHIGADLCNECLEPNLLPYFHTKDNK